MTYICVGVTADRRVSTLSFLEVWDSALNKQEVWTSAESVPPRGSSRLLYDNRIKTSGQSRACRARRLRGLTASKTKPWGTFINGWLTPGKAEISLRLMSREKACLGEKLQFDKHKLHSNFSTKQLCSCQTDRNASRKQLLLRNTMQNNILCTVWGNQRLLCLLTSLNHHGFSSTRLVKFFVT